MMMMMMMIVRLTVSENALKKNMKRAVCGQRAVRVTTAAARDESRVGGGCTLRTDIKARPTGTRHSSPITPAITSAPLAAHSGIQPTRRGIDDRNAGRY